MSSNAQAPTLDRGDAIPLYVARPSGTPRGAIIVIQEIFGVNPGIRKKADDWAAKGYLAVAPDVFWRQQPGIELDPDVPEQFQQGVGFMMKHDFDLGIRDVEAVIHWIRREQGVAQVGLVGYCMGGRIAYMAATRTDVDASVGYYGVMIDQMLGESHAIAKPLLLHVPTADHFVPPEAQKAMHEGLDDNAHVTIHDYEGLDHGFADTFGARRDEAGAQLADHFVPPEAQKAMHEGLDDNAHVTIHDYAGLDHGFADTFGARRDEAGAQRADKRTEEFFAANLG